MLCKNWLNSKSSFLTEVRVRFSLGAPFSFFSALTVYFRDFNVCLNLVAASLLIVRRIPGLGNIRST